MSCENSLDRLLDMDSFLRLPPEERRLACQQVEAKMGLQAVSRPSPNSRKETSGWRSWAMSQPAIAMPGARSPPIASTAMTTLTGLRGRRAVGGVALAAVRPAAAEVTADALRNFFIAAPMIYAAVARLAAQHATTAQIQQLKDTQQQFREAIRDGNGTERALLNERFHAVMGEMADNEYLLPSLRRLLIDHTRIGITFYNPRYANLLTQQATAADQHDQFIALIEKGDADAAANLAVAHWELSRVQIESFVTPESIQVPLGTPPGRS